MFTAIFASVIAIVAYVISSVTVTIAVTNKYFFSKRSMWAYSDISTRRVLIKNYAVKTLGIWLVKQLRENIISHPEYSDEQALVVLNRIMADFTYDYDMGKIVWQRMYDDGVFADTNATTKSYSNYDKFLNDTNYFLEVVIKERDSFVIQVREIYYAPVKKKNNIKKVLVAIMGLLILIYIIKR